MTFDVHLKQEIAVPRRVLIDSVVQGYNFSIVKHAIASATLGAEGIAAVLLLEDQPEAFADAVNRLLGDPELAARIGQSARRLAVERYSWSGAARALEGFYPGVLEAA